MLTVDALEIRDSKLYLEKFRWLAKYAGHALPNDIQQFLLKNGLSKYYSNQLLSNYNGIPLDLDIEFVMGFSNNLEHINFLIDEMLEFHVVDYGYPKHCIPFAITNSEWFVIDLEGDGKIRFVWSPENSWEFSENSITVADSFAEFLSLVRPISVEAS